MVGVSEEKIVENISVSDGIVHSTIDDVMEVTRGVRASSHRGYPQYRGCPQHRGYPQLRRLDTGLKYVLV